MTTYNNKSLRTTILHTADSNKLDTEISVPKVNVKAAEPQWLPTHKAACFVTTFTFLVLHIPHSNFSIVSEMDRCFVTFIGPGCNVTISLTSERRADIGIKRLRRDGTVANFRCSQCGSQETEVRRMAEFCRTRLHSSDTATKISTRHT